jgi:hypothetical protein
VAASCAIVTPRISSPQVTHCDAIGRRGDDDDGSHVERRAAIDATRRARHLTTGRERRRLRSKKLSTTKCGGTIFLRRSVNHVSAETRGRREAHQPRAAANL